MRSLFCSPVGLRPKVLPSLPPSPAAGFPAGDPAGKPPTPCLLVLLRPHQLPRRLLWPASALPRGSRCWAGVQQAPPKLKAIAYRTGGRSNFPERWKLHRWNLGPETHCLETSRGGTCLWEAWARTLSHHFRREEKLRLKNTYPSVSCILC